MESSEVYDEALRVRTKEKAGICTGGKKQHGGDKVSVWAEFRGVKRNFSNERVGFKFVSMGRS